MRTMRRPGPQALWILSCLLLAGCGGGGGAPAAGGPPPPPRVVIVEAGDPQVVLEGRDVVLQGHVENAEDVLLSYRWEQRGGVPVAPQQAPGTAFRFVAPTIDGTQPLDLLFAFHVTTEDGSTAADEVRVTVQPYDPFLYVGASDASETGDIWIANAMGTSADAERRTQGRVPGGYAFNLHESPDGQYVVFQADHDAHEVFDAYIATLQGPPKVTKLPFSLRGPASLRIRYRLHGWSPDGSRFLFRVDDDGDGVQDLYVADPATGSVVLLSDDLAQDLGPLVAGEGRQTWAWSHDSTRVAFLEPTGPTDSATLCVIGVDGAGKVVLTPDIVAGGHVNNIQWSPTSDHIAYAATQRAVDMRELFCVHADGTGPVRIARDMDEYERLRRMAWAPDGSRIAFTQLKGGTDQGELYTARPDGSDVARVSRELPAASVGFAPSSAVFRWSPTSERIAYWVDQDLEDRFELYTSAADGSDNQRVHGPLAPGTSVDRPVHDLWSPDGSRLVFSAHLDGEAAEALLTGDPRGGDTVPVHALPTDGGAMGVAVWSPDSASLIYPTIRFVEQAYVYEVYVSRALGTETVRISLEPRDGTNVRDTGWSAAGRAVFSSDARRAEHFALFAVDPFRGDPPVQVSHTPIPLR